MRMNSTGCAWLLVLLLSACGGGSSGADAVDDPGTTEVGEATGDSDNPQGLSVTIEADATEGNSPLTVHFSAALTGAAAADVDWAWDFDNGSTSDQAEPVMVFTEQKTYKVKLTVTLRGTIFTASDDLLIKVAPTAELRLSNVTISGPTKLAPGDQARLSFSVLNSGGPVDDAFAVNAYLSQNEVLDADDPLVTSVQVDDGIATGLYGDASIPFTDMPITIPADTAEGTWYVIVWVDATEVVTEENEEDNLKTASSILQIDPAASQKPDLTVDDLAVPITGTLSQGQNLNYQLSIANIGQADASPFKFAAYLSADKTLDPTADRKITDDDTTTIFSLASGDVRSFVKAYALPEDLPDGDYCLIVKVDSGEQIVEADETNNVRACTKMITVKYAEPEGVDLSLSVFDVLTSIVYLGGSVSTTAVVRNLGTEDSPTFKYTFFLSKEPYLNPNTDFNLGTFSGPKIPAKAEATLNDLVAVPEALDLAEGTYYLSIYVDRDNVVKEIDDSNNARTDTSGVEVTLTKNVDLQATALEFHPQQVTAGEQITVSVTIQNNGSSQSGGFFTALVFAKDATLSDAAVAAGTQLVVARLPVGGVGPGQSLDFVNKITVPASLPHDLSTFHVAAIVDDTNAVKSELSETNNSVVSPDLLTVSGTEGGCYEDDLEPDDSQATAQALEPGTHEGLGSCGNDDWYSVAVPKGSTLTVEVFATAPLAVSPKPLDLDLELKNATGATTKKGMSIGNHEKLVVLPQGSADTWYVRVYPKAAGNEAHYTLVLDVSDPSDGIDLLVDRVVVQPASIYPGGLVQILTELYNVGSEPSGAFALGYYLSPDPVLDASDTPIDQVTALQIDALGWYVDNAKHVLPVVSGGPYYVLARVDSADAVTEANEANNVGVSDEIMLDDTLVCEQDDFEPNDAQPTAAPLAATSGLYGDLSVCPQLDDWYSLDLEVGQAFQATVNYTYEAAKGMIRLELYDESMTSLLDASSDPVTPFVGLPFVYAPGTYFLRARIQHPTGAGQPQAYSLGISVTTPLPSSVCSPEPTELDNSFELASPIGCGPSSHTICNKDVDVYVGEVKAGSTFRATLDHPDLQLRLGLYLQPGDAAYDQTNGNGYVQVMASTNLTVFLVVDATNPFAALSSFTYSLFLDGMAGVDLTGTLSDAHPDPVVQGEDVRFTVGLTNGCVDASPAYDVEVYLSADQALDASDSLLLHETRGGLAGKGSESYEAKGSVPLDAEPGAYFLLLSVDASKTVHESNEANNVAALPVTVAAACVDDAFEPNDQASYAATLEAGAFPDLQLCKDDLDWYRLKAVAGQTIDVGLLFDAAAGDLDLRLYSATNLAAQLASGADTPEGEAVSYVAQSGGWYYLRISGFESSQNAYQLEVSLQ